MIPNAGPGPGAGAGHLGGGKLASEWSLQHPSL